MGNKNLNKQILSIERLVKLTVLLLVCYAIYSQLAKNNPALIYNEFLGQIELTKSYLLITCILLMFLNWLLESIKWRILVQQFYELSVLHSFKAILMGLSTGIASPNRIGEFAGRLLAVPVSKNMLSIKSNIYNSVAQNTATFIVGLFALFINKDLIIELGIYGPWMPITFVFLTLLVLVSYLKLETILAWKPILRIFGFFTSWGKLDNFKFNLRSAIIGLLLSIFRFLIYSFQYYLLLQFFGATVDPTILFGAIVLVFTLQSLIPLPPLISLVARGEIALLVFSQYNVNELTILSSTFLLWIINLVIPSLIGLVLVLKTSISESIGLK